MWSIKLDILLFLIICRVSICQRRIEGGDRVSTAKPYVVYFVKAALSDRNYDYWLCGGALVTSDFIITSAACVEDVKFLWAIAGYEKYITNENLNTNKCTKEMKKKVVFTCVPISYDFDFDRVDKWSQIDIALARVESPYDFEDHNYVELCSYIPKKIPINFEARYENPDTDCMVLGWGHEKKWRKGLFTSCTLVQTNMLSESDENGHDAPTDTSDRPRKDTKNHNNELLHYASTLIIDKKKCLSEFQYYPSMTPVIEQYSICTLGKGNIDDGGEPIDDSTEFDKVDGCDRKRRMDQQNSSCKVKDNGNPNTDLMNARRAVLKTNRTYHHNYTTRDYIKDARNKTFNRTRRNGICQNDHGGPLVTWVGTIEVLIGVASVFQIDDDNNCIGPFLHTSTQSNAAFIDCVLNETSTTKTRRDALCDSPPNVRGFDMVENHISWKDHPAGPAESELPSKI